MAGTFKEYGGKGGYLKATFDMWLLEYERLNDILKITSDCFINVRYSPDLLLKIFESLNEFYRILRPLATEEQRRVKDAEIRLLKTEIFTEMNRYQIHRQHSTHYTINENVIDIADEFYNSLMDLRQNKGLGIKAGIETSETQKIKRAVRGVD